MQQKKKCSAAPGGNKIERKKYKTRGAPAVMPNSRPDVGYCAGDASFASSEIVIY